jgi:hypothetical protein
MVLFVQLVSLNVAINSRSNALLTLLISNNFVELKVLPLRAPCYSPSTLLTWCPLVHMCVCVVQATVFKKLDESNLFQISCSGGWSCG